MLNQASEDAPGACAAPAVKDDEYFLDVVVFQVEDVLFQVYKYHFAESEGPFGALFTLPLPVDGASASTPAEGSSAVHPIVLEHDRAADFRALMKVLQPKIFPVCYDGLTVDEWIAALKLSTKYAFAAVRELALERLGKPDLLDAATTFVLGRDYDVRAWVRDACVKLVNRYSPLTAEEAEILGIPTAMKICAMREARLQCRTVYNAQAHVEAAFDDEVESS